MLNSDPIRAYRPAYTSMAAAMAVVAVAAGCSSAAPAPTLPPQIPHVVSVLVSPTVDTLVAAGQTKQFTAVARDSTGAVMTAVAFTWTSSGTGVATVSSSGLVTVVANGSATITATTSGVAGQAAVVVAIPAPQPPSGSVLFQEGFEDTQFASRGWYDNLSMAITTAESHGGSHSLEVHFTQGATVPTYGAASRHLFTPSNTVYLSYWVKYSTNWVGSGHTYHPHEFYFVTTEDAQYVGPAATHLTTYVEDNYQNGGFPRLAMTDVSNIDQTKIGQNLVGVTEQRAAAGCNGNGDAYPTDCYAVGGGSYYNEKVWTAAQPAFLPNPGPGYKNDWHFVEAYFQLNTIKNGIGQADGVAQYWVDGTLVINSQNVLFRTGAHPTMQFDQFLIGPYIGDGSPVGQTMWIDDLTVATKKP